MKRLVLSEMLLATTVAVAVWTSAKSLFVNLSKRPEK
jgi:hypothetical protein